MKLFKARAFNYCCLKSVLINQTHQNVLSFQKLTKVCSDIYLLPERS